jgi:hypothetical protein
MRNALLLLNVTTGLKHTHSICQHMFENLEEKLLSPPAPDFSKYL